MRQARALPTITSEPDVLALVLVLLPVLPGIAVGPLLDTGLLVLIEICGIDLEASREVMKGFL